MIYRGLQKEREFSAQMYGFQMKIHSIENYLYEKFAGVK